MVNPLQKIVLYVVAGVVSTFGLAYFLIDLLQCRPVSKFWDHTKPGACYGPQVVVDATYASSAISIVADLILVIIPVFVVRKLSITGREKIAAVCILAMGTLYVYFPLVNLRLHTCG